METLRKKNEGWTTYEARKIAGISIRRVNQIWNEYNETNTVSGIIRKSHMQTKNFQIMIRNSITKAKKPANKTKDSANKILFFWYFYFLLLLF
jgi:hypothetical protein